MSVSEVFDLARSGERATAVNVLKQEFQRLQSSDQKVQLCEWIAELLREPERLRAGRRVVRDGRAPFVSQRRGRELINALMALEQYERALACHEQGEDEESIQKCLQVIDELKHAYAAS